MAPTTSSPDGRGAGKKSDYFATTVDMGPTLMSMAGHHPARGLDGTDLSPLLDGDEPAAERPFAYGGYANFSFVRDDRWKYALYLVAGFMLLESTLACLFGRAKQ